ncbi:hypothetical protein PF003_g36814 [Phytophthora fragariae]|nr:hypothetical protein PF003_g36814 [Phytophthora fragariae]
MRTARCSARASAPAAAPAATTVLSQVLASINGCACSGKGTGRRSEDGFGST